MSSVFKFNFKEALSASTIRIENENFYLYLKSLDLELIALIQGNKYITSSIVLELSKSEYDYFKYYRENVNMIKSLNKDVTIDKYYHGYVKFPKGTKVRILQNQEGQNFTFIEVEPLETIDNEQPKTFLIDIKDLENEV